MIWIAGSSNAMKPSAERGEVDERRRERAVAAHVARGAARAACRAAPTRQHHRHAEAEQEQERALRVDGLRDGVLRRPRRPRQRELEEERIAVAGRCHDVRVRREERVAIARARVLRERRVELDAGPVQVGPAVVLHVAVEPRQPVAVDRLVREQEEAPDLQRRVAKVGARRDARRPATRDARRPRARARRAPW